MKIESFKRATGDGYQPCTGFKTPGVFAGQLLQIDSADVFVLMVGAER
jgi:hypothetical protein